MITAVLLSLAATVPVTVRVDAAQPQGELTPIWRFFGADEPNYAYMKDGRKLLAELGELQPRAGLLPHPQPADHRRRHARAQVGQHQRLHRGRAGPAGLRLDDRRPHLRHLPRTRRAALRPDRLHAAGAVDEARALPARVAARGCPTTTSTPAGPTRRRTTRSGASWSTSGRGTASSATAGGGASLVLGDLERGEHRLLAGHAARSSASCTTTRSPACGARCPTARVGGPDMAGCGGVPETFLRALSSSGTTTPPADRHAARLRLLSRQGRAAATWMATCGWASPPSSRPSTRASRIDRVVPGAEATSRSSSASPIPEGCAACQGPQLAYRNGTMYSSYTAASFARKHDLAARHGVNLEGALTWAFEFEDQPYFAGFRALATNGIDLPVLNVFRMFAEMGGQRMAAAELGAVPLDAILSERRARSRRTSRRSPSTRAEPARACMAWHYHDDDVPGPEAAVDLAVAGPARGRRAGEADPLPHRRAPQQRLRGLEAAWARRSPRRASSTPSWRRPHASRAWKSQGR